MDCPTCEKKLQPAEYEGTRVLQCGECSGYLVARKRLHLIRMSREKTLEVLEEEAHQERRADTEAHFRCPKCRTSRMKKERVRISEDDVFHLDVCPKCDHVWLDGGELAHLQMKFEQSAKAIDAFARQEQLRNLDSERREAFEQRLDELPTRGNFLEAAGLDLAVFGAVIALLAATVLTYWLGMWLGAVLVSLCAAATLGWAILVRGELARKWRLVAIGIIAVVEVLFLALPVGLWW